MIKSKDNNELPQNVEPGSTKAIGGLVGRLLGEPAEEVGGIIADRLRLYRYKKLIKIYDEVQKIRNNRDSEGKVTPLSPKYAIPVLEAASLEDEEAIQHLWARLIANATDPDYSEAYHPSFTHVLQELSVDEVLIIKNFAPSMNSVLIETVYEDNELLRPSIAKSELALRFQMDVLKIGLKREEYALTYFENLQRLKIFEIDKKLSPEVNSNDARGFLVDDGYIQPHPHPILGGSGKIDVSFRWFDRLMFTSFGKSFAKMCLDLKDID